MVLFRSLIRIFVQIICQSIKQYPVMFNLFSKLSFAKEHFLKCLIWFVVLLSVLVADVVLTLVSTPEPYVVYVAEKKLSVQSILTPEDTVCTRVHKGEQLKIFGYRTGSAYNQPSLWVETPDGVRGMLPVVQLDVPLKAWNKRAKTMDEVTLLSIDLSDRSYECRFPDGEVRELCFDDVEPVLPEAMTRNLMAKLGTSYNYMSRDKFERKYMGKTLAENDEEYQPATAVAWYKDTLKATYPVTVIDVKSGKRYRPTVAYDESRNAVSYTLNWEKDRSDWLISTLPLMQYVMDNPLVSLLLEGSPLEQTPLAGVEENNQEWWKMLHWYAMAVLVVIPILIWLFLTPFLPTLLIGMLLHFRKVFYPLGNKTMLVITLLVTLFSTYIWILAMLAWGMLSFCLLFYLWPLWRFFRLVARPLWNFIPHLRCPVCRRIDAFEHVKTELEREYDEWNKESVFRQLLSESTRKWQTWTDTVTTYSDGSKKHSISDRKDHKEVTKTCLYDDYQVLYHVKVYKKTFECSGCGELEYDYYNTYKEIDRKYTGQHTDTSTSTSVTPA